MFSSLAPSSQSADFPNTDMVRSDSQIFSPPPSSITPLLPSTTNQSSQESKQLISPVVDGDRQYGAFGNVKLREEDIRVHQELDENIQRAAECCCAHCKKCMSKLAHGIKDAAEGLYNILSKVVIFPVCRAGGHAVQRAADGVLGCVMFPLALSAEALPINTKGNWGIPLLGPLARAGEFFLLLKSAFDPKLTTEERVKHPLSAISGLVMGIYAMTLCMSAIHHHYLENTISIDWDIASALENLSKGDIGSLEKMCLVFGAYVSFSAAYIAGKSLVLEDFAAWVKDIQLNIKKDSVREMLASLQNINQDVANDAKQITEGLSLKNNWKDVMGRSFEGVLKASGGIGMLLDSAQRVTVPKSWLINNGWVKDMGSYTRVKVKSWASCLQKSAPQSQSVVSPATESKSLNQTSYTELLKAKEREFVTVLFYRSLFKNDGKSPYQRKIEHLLVENLIVNIANFHLNLPLLAPVLPTRVSLKTKADWQAEAKQNKHIAILLTILGKASQKDNQGHPVGTPVVEGESIVDVARKLNEALYLIMTGQAAVLNASKSPAVVATENAEVATAPSVSIGIGLSS
jgi:hypothetical protein